MVAYTIGDRSRMWHIADAIYFVSVTLLIHYVQTACSSFYVLIYDEVNIELVFTQQNISICTSLKKACDQHGLGWAA